MTMHPALQVRVEGDLFIAALVHPDTQQNHGEVAFEISTGEVVNDTLAIDVGNEVWNRMIYDGTCREMRREFERRYG